MSAMAEFDRLVEDNVALLVRGLLAKFSGRSVLPSSEVVDGLLDVLLLVTDCEDENGLLDRF